MKARLRIEGEIEHWRREMRIGGGGCGCETEKSMAEDKIKVFMLKRGEIKSRIDQCGVSA